MGEKKGITTVQSTNVFSKPVGRWHVGQIGKLPRKELTQNREISIRDWVEEHYQGGQTSQSGEKPTHFSVLLED